MTLEDLETAKHLALSRENVLSDLKASEAQHTPVGRMFGVTLDGILKSTIRDTIRSTLRNRLACVDAQLGSLGVIIPTPASVPASWDPVTREFEFVLASRSPGRTTIRESGKGAISVQEFLDMGGLVDLAAVGEIPLLHRGPAGTEHVCGRIVHARIEGNEFVCRGRLDSMTPAIAAMERGEVHGVRCDYVIHREDLRPAVGEGLPVALVRSWQPCSAVLETRP